MKVISLLQPWATLAVIGAKKIETRSWNTKYRGEILIHASKKLTKQQILLGQNFNSKFGVGLGFVDSLPTGAIIGKVNVIDTFQFDEQTKDSLIYYYDHENKIGWELNEQELTFGDYSPGRYGWLVSDPVQFAIPIPAKGKRSIWEYDMPDHFHVPIPGGGHATFPSPPNQDTLDAINMLVEIGKKIKNNE